MPCFTNNVLTSPPLHHATKARSPIPVVISFVEHNLHIHTTDPASDPIYTANNYICPLLHEMARSIPSADLLVLTHDSPQAVHA